MRRHLILKRATALLVDRSLCHQRMTDDERGLALDRYRTIESTTDLLRVIAIDVEDLPAPGAILHRHVLAIHLVYTGGELHLVGIVKHDQVIQPKVTRQTTGSL